MTKWGLIIVILALPTFLLMLRHGVYTMHDFHFFRQFEFDKCLQQYVFPCRWAPDASLGYGQPLFNFYGQFTYWLGSVWQIIGFSVINSVKGVFILSLVGSGLAMFALARNYWGDRGGVVSAVLYMYAPYRAVDVWVRGALPEALGFVFFPLIWLCLDRFISTRRYSYLFWLILLSAGLLITHNLSFLMFLPFAGVWAVYCLWRHFSRTRVEDLVSAGLVVALLAAFYLLPVVFESRFVTLGSVVRGYYDYRSHFVSLRQLFWSNFWGYGGSVWGTGDGMSFAVGYLQWGLALVVGIGLIVTKKIDRYWGWMIITGLAIVALFLTHGKSEIVWRIIPAMAYLQFPWRFLSVAVFLLALAAGLLVQLTTRWVAVTVVLLAILVNHGFFRPDIWLPLSDHQYFSGKLWDEQRSSAKSDFWPNTAPKLPTEFAFSGPRVILSTQKYQKIQYPIVYFPGWKAWSNNQPLDIFPSGNLGLITVRVPAGQTAVLRFTNTLVRSIGNWVSLLALVGLVVWRIKYVKD